MYGGDQDHINAAVDPSENVAVEVPPNNMQRQDEGAVEQPPASGNPANSADMSDRSGEDGFVHINNQHAPPNNNPLAPGGMDDLAKPQFGPQAAQILAPMSQAIQRANTQGLNVPQNFDTHV